jgi:peroxiredoxin Q/BCP
MECRSLRESGKEIRGFDVAYFAASTDPPETNRRFAESLGLDYPVLSDPGGETARAYGAYSEERGIALRWTFYIGADGTVLHVDRDVKPSSAGADVVARLEQLGIPRAGAAG